MEAGLNGHVVLAGSGGASALAFSGINDTSGLKSPGTGPSLCLM